MILLVEDDAAGRTTIAGLLRNRGYEVAEAENGGNAVALLEEKRTIIDLVITDMVLPHLPKVPIVMLSNCPLEKEDAKIRRRRLIFLAETSDPSALLAIVEQALAPSVANPLPNTEK